MQAIILAGGKGTRLGKLTTEVPKPMIQIGDMPIIEYQVRLLKNHNITNIIIVVNHLKQPLIDYMGDGAKWGVNISYFEEETPLGTSGALPLFVDQLEDSFLVVYGDVMVDMDMGRLIRFHQEKKADATLVVHPNDHPYDSDLVEVDADHQIIAFHSKPHPEHFFYKNLVNAGVYLFEKSVIGAIEPGVKKDFGKDIFPEWVKTKKLFGYNTPEYLKDMGTPDRLTKVSADLASGKIEQMNLRNKQKAIFLDRDGVINEDRHLIHKPEDLVLYPFTADAIKKINQSDYLSIVATNQSVVARNLCTIEELEFIHKKLHTELGDQGAKLDELYYCPYHPDKGYPEENPAYKREHPWRKPSPGMLLEGAKNFNIDLAKSFMIGDRESDIIAGKRAGVRTIAVRTGHGFTKATEEPDFIFQNLKEAVNFIIDDPLGSFCGEVFHKTNQAKSTPALVLIGGNAQSGKSTLAQRLTMECRKHNFSATRISLDHFLLPDAQRKEAKTVFERFDLDTISAKIQDYLSGNTIHVTAYHKNPALDRTETLLEYNGEKVVIVEGVPALANEPLRQLADLKIFVDLQMDPYKQRFYDLYDWKGFPKEEIDELFATRVKDEFELIDETRKYADLTLNPVK